MDRPKRETKKRWYPTDLTKCSRQLFYKKTNEEPTNPPEAGAVWKMEMGNVIHDKIFQFVKECIDPHAEEEVAVTWDNEKGPVTVPEVYDEAWERENYPVWLLSGRVDIVFNQGGKLKGIENKTSFGMGIKLIQQKGEPKDDHLAQCIAYLSTTDIEEMWLFYFGRDNAYRTVFKVWLDGDQAYYAQSDTGYEAKLAPVQFGDMMNRLRGIEMMIGLGSMPARDFQVAIMDGEIKDKFVRGKVQYKSDWQCRYCDFKDLCWIDERIKYAQGNNMADFHQ
jgi:hypothetical protein